MCGICGIINSNQVPVKNVSIRQMMHIMKHRGPDDEGIFEENNVGLGFVRLSIIDLSPAGHQPKVSIDGRYVMVFNGEIYNYIELREELISEGLEFKTKTDSEVLLNAYIQWGENCLHRFNGMWSFVIYDRKEQQVFASRDRFGIKPFYYIIEKDFFAFCSEIQPLLILLKQKPKPDHQSIFDFLVFNRTDQTERTFFEEVKKLPHGNTIHIDLNTTSNIATSVIIAKWYDLRKRVSESEGFLDAGDYRRLLTSSIGFRLRSDVPVGVCLSGGLDSSSIVSLLLNDYNKKDLNTFSAVYKKGQVGDESEFINEYKDLVHKMYYTKPDGESLEKDLIPFIKAQGEPIPSTSPYAQFKVMKLAQGKVVVTIDGQGADEELAGYHYFYGYYFKDLFNHWRFDKLFYEMYHYLAKHNDLIGIKSFLFFMLPKRLRTKARVNEKWYIQKDFANKYKNSNSIAGNLYGSKSLTDALLDHFEFKLDHLLKWEDRNSMFFSLESRVPFLDYRLVEKTIASSSNWKIRKGMTKYILRESMKGILPEKIRKRRDKVGFDTPQDEWFREAQWQKIINEILDSNSFKSRGLIDNQIAKDLYQKHLSRRINISKEIWKWIHLELWFREYIDE